MKTIGVLSVLGLLCLGSTAQAASVITVVNRDTKTITTTTEHGTAVTEVRRNGNTLTTTTTFQRNTYQPTGAGGYKPTGGSGYNPMGSR